MKPRYARAASHRSLSKLLQREQIDPKTDTPERTLVAISTSD